MAREALFSAPEGDPVGFHGLRDIAWGLLSVVDLFEDQRPDLRDPTSVEALESLLLRRIARPPVQLRNTLPRTHRLFMDLPRAYPDSVRNFDLDQRAQELAGIGIARYVAICLTFHTRFASVPRDISQAQFEPVICLLDGFRSAPLLRERIDRIVDEARLLQMDGVGKLSVISAEEFELACAVVERGASTMARLLASWHQDEQFRDWPLRDDVRRVVGDLPMTSLIDREFTRVVGAIAAEIAAA